MTFNKQKLFLFNTMLLLGLSPVMFAQAWDTVQRGSWVRNDETQSGDVLLADHVFGCEIVCSGNENSAVKQAAYFLAKDILKISGYEPPICEKASGNRMAVHLVTLGNGKVPGGIAKDRLKGKWESYQIITFKNNVWLVGSNFRGTAFAAYTLSERLGIDPLYIWTGYTPEKHPVLVLKNTNYFVDTPDFKYRGFFHDDQDILPRPLDENGIPMWSGGIIPMEWYKRYFETALRLRLNMVAPYVRVQRPFEVQKLASDWGLYYTSHHYDVLLSNPWGYERFGLAEKRNAGKIWDWFKNREGMINFWRGGVTENGELDCIWPVGMRGTSDSAYEFDETVTREEKNRVFSDILNTQVNLAKENLPEGKEAVFHFTLYHEMLDNFLKGNLDIPQDVIIIWSDDGDGIMPGLPDNCDRWKHGVYYHLAFKGWSTKQITHIVSPKRIEEQFRRIVSSGATEYMLVNVSELRDYVMEARMIAELCWDSNTAFSKPGAADRYINWWCREYFAKETVNDAVIAYHKYYQLLDEFDKLRFGKLKLYKLLNRLDKKFSKEPFDYFYPEDRFLEKRNALMELAFERIECAKKKMTTEQERFFSENVELGLLFDWRPTQAALILNQALEEPDLNKAWQLCQRALSPLEQLENEIVLAERTPFEGWYGLTEARKWFRYDQEFPLRRAGSPHGSYLNMKEFLRNKYEF